MHKSKALDLYNWFVDVFVSRIRFVFSLFLFADLLAGAVRSVYLFCVNEALKARMGKCGQGVRLNGRVKISDPASLVLGANVHINDGAYLRSEGGVEILDNVHISRNFTLYSRNHRYKGDLLPYDSVNVEKPVYISRNVWVGMNVCVAPGVSVGEGAIIGMGVVLTRDVAPFEIVVSAGTVTIGKRDEEHYRRLDEAREYGGASGYLNRHI